MEYFKNKDIKSLSLMTTLNCNLNCRYCYIKQSYTNMSIGVIKTCIDLFLKSDGKKKRIVFLGGEPLLNRPLIEWALDYIDKQRPLYRNKTILTLINTNGTILGEKEINLFKNIDFISISLDGLKTTQDKNRLYKNGESCFDTIIRNINKINMHFDNKILINKVITSNNYKSLYRDVLFLSRLHPYYINLNVALGDPGWDENKVRDFLKITKSIFDWVTSNKNISKKFKNMFGGFFSKCAVSHLVCSPEGNLYPCEILFRLKKDSIGDLDHIRSYLLNCRFSPKNERCRLELCHSCNQICKRISFCYGKVMAKSVTVDDIKWLDRARIFQGLFSKLKYGKEEDIIGEALRVI